MQANKPPFEYELVPCIGCGGIETRLLFSEKHQGMEFCVAQCEHCGLVYLNPRPSFSEMRRLYPDPHITRVSDMPGLRVSPAIKPRVGFRTKYMDFYKRLAKNSSEKTRVLDFVCRDGSFLEVLRERYGWQELYGIENRPVLVKVASEKGFKVFPTPIEQAKFPDRFFDVVVMRHTLEHLYNPNGDLREVCRILKDDGFLRVEVPNISGLSKSISGKRWAGFYIPRHLYDFSPKTLIDLLRKANFEAVEVLTLPYPHYLLHPFKFLTSLMPKREGQAVRKKVSDSVLIGAVLAPVNFAASLAGRGDEIMVICKKGQL